MCDTLQNVGCRYWRAVHGPVPFTVPHPIKTKLQIWAWVRTGNPICCHLQTSASNSTNNLFDSCISHKPRLCRLVSCRQMREVGKPPALTKARRCQTSLWECPSISDEAAMQRIRNALIYSQNQRRSLTLVRGLPLVQQSGKGANVGFSAKALE